MREDLVVIDGLPATPMEADLVSMSSVMLSVATPPTSRSAAVRTIAPVPHQNAAPQRFLPGWIAR
jgi:hypothetical protein